MWPILDCGEMDSGDEQITCRACGTTFTFAEGERAWFAERGYQPPVYCRDCRDVRRATATPAKLEAYPTVCDSCGQPTTVPFKPTPGRPIYCDECFRMRRSAVR